MGRPAAFERIHCIMIESSDLRGFLGLSLVHNGSMNKLMRRDSYEGFILNTISAGPFCYARSLYRELRFENHPTYFDLP